jgi:GntR family transcriptional regulator
VLIRVRPTDARPIYLQIMEEVRRAIALGLVEADEPLPSVRQLATDLRINPNTVQQAYRELERDGLVYARRGRGTFVAELRSTKRERQVLAREVAERAVRDAYGRGLTVEELVEAVRRLAETEKRAGRKR